MQNNPGFARIRVTKEQASWLWRLLSAERHELVIDRAELRDDGHDYKQVQKEITFVTHLQDEVKHAMSDLGIEPSL